MVRRLFGLRLERSSSVAVPTRLPDAGAVVLAVSGLRVEVARDGEPIVDGVDLELRAGEVLGVVGESGSGKPTTALALLGYARAGARVAGGSVRVGTHEFVGRKERDLRALRGRVVSYVPQDPSSALNPSMRIE